MLKINLSWLWRVSCSSLVGQPSRLRASSPALSEYLALSCPGLAAPLIKHLLPKNQEDQVHSTRSNKNKYSSYLTTHSQKPVSKLHLLLGQGTSQWNLGSSRLHYEDCFLWHFINFFHSIHWILGIYVKNSLQNQTRGKGSTLSHRSRISLPVGTSSGSFSSPPSFGSSSLPSSSGSFS